MKDCAPTEKRNVTLSSGIHDWYKDAIIYHTHIKAFFDANDDGIGDFAGLTAKLDYIAELGVTAIWILPFYPSPLRDDGYDISDYRGVNPSYGTLRDFRRFVRACHARGLRVITELVVNHTSDQHPWFQRARRARPGSAARNFYVWSDSDQKYRGTRIIFLDTEQSNWAWDPVAKAYYWHRFYSHQPDLNFDNPRVVAEILKILHYWMGMGVDGMRLDAVPYLIEREGTSNENLPATHEILKRFRAEVDTYYPGRMLLAEANQWPEDVCTYFGDDDECHMAFHFPLMPRIYMAIAEEDRHPITDIMNQTPEIPPNCQWALFLRNHDELTLEMVTSRERDHLWRYYANDPRARINLGIRRRLAPLVENDRSRIELMNALLFSMPGTPILYYGDEIGMGDNVFLGDRDGVRTPMQWSPDRNGGFSRADPAQLYLPPVMNAQYGYEAVNVEAQRRIPSSLLNWTRHLISVRREEPAFGRGGQRFFYPANRRILAYLREHEGRVILCVFNLGRSSQAVELELGEYRGRVPVELFGRAEFPRITDLPYVLTLPGYGWFWFVLVPPDEASGWHAPLPDLKPEFPTLVVRRGLPGLADGEAPVALERQALPAFLPLQRWFSGKGKSLSSVRLKTLGMVAESDGEGQGYWLAMVTAQVAGGRRSYFLPLALDDEDGAEDAHRFITSMLARVRQGSALYALVDAVSRPGFARALVAAMVGSPAAPSAAGGLRFRANPALAREGGLSGAVRSLGAEQSHSSLRLGERLVLKIYRRLATGVHPELEVTRFLNRAGYANTAPLLGSVEYVDRRGRATALAAVFGFLINQGDGWGYTLDYLERALEMAGLAGEGATNSPFVLYVNLAATLGRRTAELHLALAAGARRGPFAPQPITPRDVARWSRETRAMAWRGLRAVAHPERLAQDLRPAARALYGRREEVLERMRDLGPALVGLRKIRIHGDYHLGQVLIHEGDWFVLDFEGEPERPLAARREKRSPLKDVAGMLRSFDYAAAQAHRAALVRGVLSAEDLRWAVAEWRERAGRAFLEAYLDTAADLPGIPESRQETMRVIRLFMLEKALYELGYEAANRPDWLGVPIEGVLALLEPQETECD